MPFPCRRRASRGRWLTPSLLLAPLLGGCSQPDSFAPPCPALALLKDGADLKRFAGAGRDVTDLALDARLTRVDASCARDNPTMVRATLVVGMDIARGPAGPRSSEVPYFVAVTEGDRILDRQDFSIRGSFPQNIDRVSVRGEEISLLLPVTATRKASDYRIYVSFSLTAAELAINRRDAAR